VAEEVALRMSRDEAIALMYELLSEPPPLKAAGAYRSGRDGQRRDAHCDQDTEPDGTGGISSPRSSSSSGTWNWDRHRASSPSLMGKVSAGVTANRVLIRSYCSSWSIGR
jgi:hypothetical protein